MGFSIETSVPILTVFLQGLLSFFSPCVLPLLPMYISYLSGGGRTMDQEGNVHYKRGRVLLNTAFFVVEMCIRDSCDCDLHLPGQKRVCGTSAPVFHFYGVQSVFVEHGGLFAGLY